MKIKRVGEKGIPYENYCKDHCLFGLSYRFLYIEIDITKNDQQREKRSYVMFEIPM